MAILEVKNLHKEFGGLKAVNHCSFEVKENSITGLIGPNGAGKTTLFNLISGFVKPTAGHIYLKNKNITKFRPHKRAIKGLGRSFQAIRVFPEMKVIDNVLIAFKEHKQHLSHSFISTKKHRTKLHEKAVEILKRVTLHEKMHLDSNELSFGQQKLLEIAQCIAKA